MSDTTPPSRPRGPIRMVPGISFANKSQLLFGASLALILMVALAVPWVRGTFTARQLEDHASRGAAEAWFAGRRSIEPNELASQVFLPSMVGETGSIGIAVVLMPDATDDVDAASEPGAAVGGSPDGSDASNAAGAAGAASAANASNGSEAAPSTGDADAASTATPGEGSGPAATPVSPAAPGDTGPSGAPPNDVAVASPRRAGAPAMFVVDAASYFRRGPEDVDYLRRYTSGGRTVLRLAHVLTAGDLAGMRSLPPALQAAVDAAIGRDGREASDGSASRAPSVETPPTSPAASEASSGAAAVPVASPGSGPGTPVALLIIDRDTRRSESLLLQNRIFMIAVGGVGVLASIGLFWLILKKLILSPVRTLRETAEAVQDGDLTIRSDIRTGDEFEQLAGAFNEMLDRLEAGRDELQRMNRTLDLKVDQLAEANVGLDEANRLKSEFVAGVSHELRTPLNSIIGFAELLLELAHTEGDADPKRDRYLNNILGSGRRLLEMINELLDMAKIEAGRMEVAIEPTAVGDLVEGLTRIMGPQAQQKGVDLDTVIADRLPVVETDPGKLQQILFNFMSNAIKFTPAGGTVQLVAERISRQGRPLAVRLSVIDSGPGIGEDLQEMIFEKFRQADAGHTREHAGTGLGLAICRSLAEMLGAEVSCASIPGQGATFAVELPAAYRPEQPQSLMG